MKCHDCPDLALDAMVANDPNWKPRAKCCADVHVERRLGGSFEPWQGHEKARELADTEDAHRTRQQRRYEERKGRR